MLKNTFNLLNKMQFKVDFMMKYKFGIMAKHKLNCFSSQSKLEELIKSKLKVKELSVIDNSGGCGQSFVIKITSEDFNNKSLIQQHKLMNEILKEELKEIHSIQYFTKQDK